MSILNEPHGGVLIDVMAGDKQSKKLRFAAQSLKSWNLTARQICDLEMILNGGFSPLKGFMDRNDYESVVSTMRLGSGLLWPIPITLDVDQEFAQSLKRGEQIALRDPEGVVLAILSVGDVWKPDLSYEAKQVYGKDDSAHPAVAYMNSKGGAWYVGGEVLGLELPTHYDFRDLRDTPASLRAAFESKGWDKVIAFQTRNPMHRAHVEAVRRSAEATGAKVLIQPVVGMTKPGDIDHYTRVRIYKKVIERLSGDDSALSLLPLAMRMGGPREALWHCIIRKNYGMSHFIVGRDHAGPGKDSSGEDFYDPFAAMELAQRHADEIGIGVTPAGLLSYVKDRDAYMNHDEITDDMEVMSISGTQMRERLAAGEELPEWFTYPEVAEHLREVRPPLDRRGVTVFFTGLSGSGKSAVANALRIKLMQRGGRNVTLLDGDIVRKHLTSELGFSKEHRDLNIQRISYVASEIAKHGGIAITAAIAPYAHARKMARELVESEGGVFLLVHMATPIEVCEARDRKGMYKAAREGIIKEFTGVSDPYETPVDADVVLDSSQGAIDDLAEELLALMVERGLL